MTKTWTKSENGDFMPVPTDAERWEVLVEICMDQGLDDFPKLKEAIESCDPYWIKNEVDDVLYSLRAQERKRELQRKMWRAKVNGIE
jgi:hypothetical protein